MQYFCPFFNLRHEEILPALSRFLPGHFVTGLDAGFNHATQQDGCDGSPLSWHLHDRCFEI